MKYSLKKTDARSTPSVPLALMERDELRESSVCASINQKTV